MNKEQFLNIIKQNIGMYVLEKSSNIRTNKKYNKIF
jgi:hypothetical protein